MKARLACSASLAFLYCVQKCVFSSTMVRSLTVEILECKRNDIPTYIAF